MVALRNPLPWVKKNGNTAPNTISPPARALLHHRGRRDSIACRRTRQASRHSLTCFISSSMPSTGLSCLLTQQAARPEHHDHDQVAEHDHRGPLRAEAGVRELLDAADDEAAEHGAADVP